MRMKAKITLLISLLLPAAAWACPEPPYPSTDACLSWTAPTQNTDGSPITGLLAYRVYRDGVYMTTTTALFLDMKMQPPGNRCYFVTAVVGSMESAPSATNCKLIRLPAPTNGSIEAPTEGSFEP